MVITRQSSIDDIAIADKGRCLSLFFIELDYHTVSSLVYFFGVLHKFCAFCLWAYLSGSVLWMR